VIRTALYVVAGIILGGVIHIAIVFLVPYYASRDAWAQMKAFGRDGQFQTLPIPEPGAEPLASLDPRMVQAVCRFALDGGPVHLRASLPDDFWSVAVFDRRGRNVYSINDGATQGSSLDMTILTSVQMAQLRQSPPASLDQSIVLELPIDAGFVLIRVFVADETLLPAALAALKGANCASGF
jgi:uncharacterized membrane protein